MVPRSIKVPEDLWAEASELAAAEGETLSQIMRVALRNYVKRKRAQAANVNGASRGHAPR